MLVLFYPIDIYIFMSFMRGLQFLTVLWLLGGDGLVMAASASISASGVSIGHWDPNASDADFSTLTPSVSGTGNPNPTGTYAIVLQTFDSDYKLLKRGFSRYNVNKAIAAKLKREDTTSGKGDPQILTQDTDASVSESTSTATVTSENTDETAGTSAIVSSVTNQSAGASKLYSDVTMYNKETDTATSASRTLLGMSTLTTVIGNPEYGTTTLITDVSVYAKTGESGMLQDSETTTLTQSLIIYTTKSKSTSKSYLTVTASTGTSESNAPLTVTSNSSTRCQTASCASLNAVTTTANSKSSPISSTSAAFETNPSGDSFQELDGQLYGKVVGSVYDDNGKLSKAVCDSSNSSYNSSFSFHFENGVIYDQAGRVGAVVSNYQFQFDGPPPQTGTIYAAGWSLTDDNYLALGNNTVFYACAQSGSYKIFYQKVYDSCFEVMVKVTSSGC